MCLPRDTYVYLGTYMYINDLYVFLYTVRNKWYNID